jgi:hypothetical protein
MGEDGIRAEKTPCRRMELRRHSMNEIEYAITNFEEFLEADTGQGDLHMCSAEIALAALREQAERNKGCGFCCYQEHPDKTFYPKEGYAFYAGFSKQIDVDAFDEIETDEIKYCPMCGKRLEVEP